MWGWLSGIADGIGNIVSGVTSIPGQIVSGIGNFFNTLWEWLGNIWDSIKSIPGQFIDGIKSLFIPDGEAIKAKWSEVCDNISGKFGFQVFYDTLNKFDDVASAPSDIEATYDGGLWKFSGTFVNFEYFVQVVNAMRPYIRGFVALLVAFFHARQFLGLFHISMDEVRDASMANSIREFNGVK